MGIEIEFVRNGEGMRTVFFETTMGASGDMILGALLGLMENKEAFVEKINNIGLEGVAVSTSIETSMGIAGNRVRVSIDGTEEGEKISCDKETLEDSCCGKHHKRDRNHIALMTGKHGDNHHGEGGHRQSHSHHHDNNHKCCGKHRHEPKEKNSRYDHSHHDLAMIASHLDRLNVSDKIKNQAKEIYRIIADAEALVHNRPAEQIHFHEVGEKDAIFDIVAVCLAMELLGAERILSTPIHVGYGKVRTDHGKLPIPAPATAEILKGIPIYSKDIRGELCTPTGAALLKYFVQDFCRMPLATWEKIGYGVGARKFNEPNILRAFLGKTEEMGSDNGTD